MTDPADMSRRLFFRSAGNYLLGATVAYSALSLSNPITYAAESIDIHVPLATVPITVDGKWTTADEWTDGQEMHSSGALWRIKHDADYLGAIGHFVQFDSKSTSQRSLDAAWVYLDTRKDGGSTPKEDDYAFGIVFPTSSQSSLQMLRGNGTGWTEIQPAHSAASSLDTINSPYKKRGPYAIYELKIPKNLMGPDTTSVNARFSMHDGSTDTWTVLPGGSSRDNPSQWIANLLLLSTPIPEFHELTLPLVLALGLPMLALRKFRANRARAKDQRT